MASTSGDSTVVIIPFAILIIAIINSVIVSGVREGELNVVLGVLRARGYHLFANAIATSDVHYDIKSDNNFTLFAPINSALFALDMTMPASNYVSALRYHVVPRRMSIPDLLSLPPGSNSVPTLAPCQDIIVEQRQSLRSLITVGGVDIVVPGMFYGRDIAVHGLDGVLEYKPHTKISPANSTFPKAAPLPPPPPVSNSTVNQTSTHSVAAPTPAAVPSPVTPPKARGIAVRNSKQAPINSTSIVLGREKRRSRSKLLELSSDGMHDLSPTSQPASNRLREFTPVDEETIDLPLADNAGDVLNASPNMICAQK